MLTLALLLAAFSEPTRPVELANERYRIHAAGVIRVELRSVAGASRTLVPRLEVSHSPSDPGYFMYGRLREEVTATAGWKRASAAEPETDLYRAAQPVSLLAESWTAQAGRRVRYRFPPQPAFEVALTLELPLGNEAPVLELELAPRAEGWYSVGLAALQPEPAADQEFLFQPLVWQWKRFPARSYLTPEHFANTPAVLRTRAGVTEGLAADPREIPYRFATAENSRFGVLLRDAAGLCRPTLFAPIFGGAESRRRPGETYRFRVRYLLAAGGWYAGIQHVLRDILGYRNERRNATHSLNETLENMIELGMNDVYSGWVEELRGFDYRFDVPGTVKVVSALHALGIALVTGDSEIYRRRARPLIEYVLSREKYLYAVSEEIKQQSPSHFLRGPCVELGELAGLHRMMPASEVFRREAERIFGRPRVLNLETLTGGASWQDELALYRITGDPARLGRARRGADEHIRREIERYPDDFNTNPALRDKQACFYTDYGPRWFDLYELYEETRDRKYLEAAAVGARAMLLLLRSHPFAPPESIVVNRGGRVPGVFGWRRVSATERAPFDSTSIAPEQRIPAWRTSLVGLPFEQGYTYNGGGPIMLTHHAAWLLRLAALTQDKLLADAAYNAVLGRYANFPGYYFRSLETNVYQLPDYARRPYHEIKYNAIFYNHIWPHIALLADFLVSDAFYRSAGEIDFPSAYAPGYAFLTSKVYGHAPGRIFGHRNLYLWLPRRGARFSTTAVNHLFAVGDRGLYVVLMNTEGQEVAVEVQLNADVIPWDVDREYRLLRVDRAGETPVGWVRNGKFQAKVAGYGIAAFCLEGLRARNPLAGAGQTVSLSANAVGYHRRSFEEPALGTVTAMLLNLVPEYADAYVYSDATEKQALRMRLVWRRAEGAWQTLEDVSYPFEFSLRLDNPGQPLRFRVEAQATDGSWKHTPEMELRN